MLPRSYSHTPSQELINRSSSRKINPSQSRQSVNILKSVKIHEDNNIIDQEVEFSKQKMFSREFSTHSRSNNALKTTSDESKEADISKSFSQMRFSKPDKPDQQSIRKSLIMNESDVDILHFKVMESNNTEAEPSFHCENAMEDNNSNIGPSFQFKVENVCENVMENKNSDAEVEAEPIITKIQGKSRKLSLTLVRKKSMD